jgi:hypothetical protein
MTRGPLSSPAFGKGRLAPWNSSSGDGLVMPRDAARFSISAATAIADSATAVKRVVTGHVAASSAKPIDATSKVPRGNSIIATISATIVCASPIKKA